jgi:hypothetical protein
METELEFTGKPYPHWKRRFFTIWTGQAVSMLGSQMMVQVWHIYVVMFIRSSSGQFQWAAMTASTSLMVPRKQLSRVAGALTALVSLLTLPNPSIRKMGEEPEKANAQPA